MKTRELIKSDLFRYHGRSDILEFIKSFFLIEGFRYMFFHRLKSSLSKNNPFYWFLFFVVRYYGSKYGFQILTTKIGAGLYIGHFGTVIVNGGASLGNNINLSPGVVIGQVSRGRMKGVPKICDNVWIGTNAIIVGNITIGKNVIIAPGSYVTFDVPDFSLVRGNPGEIQEGKGVEGYICNPYNLNITKK